MLVCNLLHGCRVVSVRGGKKRKWKKILFFIFNIIYFCFVLKMNLQSTSQGHNQSPFTLLRKMQIYLTADDSFMRF